MEIGDAQKFSLIGIDIMYIHSFQHMSFIYSTCIHGVYKYSVYCIYF